MFFFRSIRHLQEASATDGKGKFLCIVLILLLFWPAFPKALCLGTAVEGGKAGGPRCWLLAGRVGGQGLCKSSPVVG